MSSVDSRPRPRLQGHASLRPTHAHAFAVLFAVACTGANVESRSDGGAADAGGSPRGNVPVGVHIGRIPETADFGTATVIPHLIELGATAVRINVRLDGEDVDPKPYLAAGFDVVLTVAHRDTHNIVGGETSAREHPAAGFPFVDGVVYEGRIRELLSPLVDTLPPGRKVWVQCENEVAPYAKYWQGSAEEYLRQIEAFSRAVRAVAPGWPVVLTSFASRALDGLLDDNRTLVTEVTTLLTRASAHYDAIDLHFYGCVSDIGAKIAWFADWVSEGKVWISTENAGPDSRCRTEPGEPFEEVQARQVSERLGACLDGGAALCLWFSLFDLSGEEDWFSRLGLLTDPRMGSLRKKPAFDTFVRFASSR